MATSERCLHFIGFFPSNEMSPRAKYIEDIQVFGRNMSFISLSEVNFFYIS